MASWELESEVLVAVGLCDLGRVGGITLAAGLYDVRRRAVTLLNYICLTTEKNRENLNRSSQVVKLLVAPSCLGWPAEQQFTTLTRGVLQSALSGHKCLPSCRNRGFSASANFEFENFSQNSHVVGEKWNSRNLVNLPVTKAQL
jgi:hypothetical protein